MDASVRRSGERPPIASRWAPRQGAKCSPKAPTFGEYSLEAFHNGRGSQEGIFAELKSQAQMDYIPTRRQAGNRVYLLAAMLAHNLSREMQMVANKRQRGTTEKRAPLWKFTQLGRLRRKLIQRAGRLTRPQRKLTLTMSENPTVKLELLHYLNAIKAA